MRNFDPKSREFNERKITREQRGFPDGVWNDIPGTEIPKGGVSYSKNYLLFPDRAEARGGTKAWSTTTLPSLKTGLSVTKSGTTVTKTVGEDFSQYDVGNYIVYDDGKHELITGYTDANTVTVGSSASHGASTAAWTHGPYELFQHDGVNKLVLHIDNRLYYSDPITISWVRIPVIGPYRLSYNPSKCFFEVDNYGILFDDNGIIFKINMDEYKAYPLNAREPTQRISDVAKTVDYDYGYKVLYAMSRITGESVNRDRRTTDETIELMTGPTQPGTDDYKDFGEIWAERPIGEASTTYGILTGGTLSAPYSTISQYAAVSDAQYKMTIDGTTRNVESNFTGATTWEQIGSIMENDINDTFPESTVKVEWDTDHWVFTSNTEGGTIGFVTAGDGGTDFGTSALACESGTGTITTPAPSWTSPVQVTVYMPVDKDDGELMQHFNFYSIYRTLDIGENGIDPQTGDGNNKELFIWEGDYPVAKAFTGAVISNQVISVEAIFTKSDVGDTVTFEDGTEVTTTSYVDAYTMGCSHANVSSQSACLGGGSVITASQTGTTVTATSGHSFADLDVGTVIYWANGLRSTIVSVTSATVAVVAESLEISSQSATFDPVSRTISLTARDDYNGTDTTIKQLRTRAAGFSLPNRFWTALPKGCNTGAIVNGMLITAERGKRKYYYSQLPDKQEYLAGYFNEYHQVGIIKDKIQFVIPFDNGVTIAGAHSLTAIPLNTFSTVTIPEVGEVVIVVTGQFEIDKNIGCKDWGSIAMLPRNRAMFISTEPGLQMLEGNSSGGVALSGNLARRRFQKKLEASNGQSSAFYCPINGYVWWTRDTQKQISEEDLVWNLVFDNDEAYDFVAYDDDAIRLII